MKTTRHRISRRRTLRRSISRRGVSARNLYRNASFVQLKLSFENEAKEMTRRVFLSLFRSAHTSLPFSLLLLNPLTHCLVLLCFQTGLALVDIVALTATVFALTVRSSPFPPFPPSLPPSSLKLIVLHKITADSLPTEISTTWFLGPYCSCFSPSLFLSTFLFGSLTSLPSFSPINKQAPGCPTPPILTLDVRLLSLLCLIRLDGSRVSCSQK